MMSTVYVLGAGASRELGVPTVQEFYRDGMERLKGDPRVRGLESFVDRFPGKEKKPTIEELFTLIDLAVEGNYALGQKDPGWDLPRLKHSLLYFLSQTILWTARKESSSAPNPYEKLATLLREGDTVISFNYDLFMANALLAKMANMPPEWRSFPFPQGQPEGWKSLMYWPAEKRRLSPEEQRELWPNGWPSPDRKSIAFFPLHGALGWLFCHQCNLLNFLMTFEDGVKDLNQIKNIDALQNPDQLADKLRFCYPEEIDLGNWDDWTCNCGSRQLTQLILPPSMVKKYEISQIRRMWGTGEENSNRVGRPDSDASSPKPICVPREEHSEPAGAQSALDRLRKPQSALDRLRHAEKVVFIGYSLPDADFRALFLFVEGLVFRPTPRYSRSPTMPSIHVVNPDPDPEGQEKLTPEEIRKKGAVLKKYERIFGQFDKVIPRQEVNFSDAHNEGNVYHQVGFGEYVHQLEER